MKNFIFLLTGLPCSGKTTLARNFKKFNNIIHLDGDEIRKGLCSDLGFSMEDRKENIRRIKEVCKLFSITTEFDIFLSFIVPTEELRQILNEPDYYNFQVIYVKCTIAKCIKRDVKGMFKKAINGEIKNFTGIDGEFEEPKNPDLIVDTSIDGISKSTHDIIKFYDNIKGNK